jgi:hypothetical protein
MVRIPKFGLEHQSDGSQRHLGGETRRGKSTYFFEWEGEWRKIADFNFDTDDVECLIIPEDLHGAAKNFFIDVKQENPGPV